MFDLLFKTIAVAFKPLFDTSKEAIIKFSEPRRKLVRSLLSLYEDLEEIELLSDSIIRDVENYVSKDWAAWTVARNKRERLVEATEKLRKTTNRLGKSLRDLYQC
jgi:hypothetical protein